jgi:Zn-finger nucleic acid-binding protein
MPAMNAETLNCPNCGAASSAEQPKCHFCGSRLATIACSSCFAMMFVGSKHCQRCGTAAVEPEIKETAGRKCPRCLSQLAKVTIGSTEVIECESCLGLWLGVDAFAKVCAEREQQSAVLGLASHAPSAAVPETSKVKYVPCPDCSQLMNRINFARCSGVVVDVCKGHGTWFDRDELSRIVEFIRAGGLEVARTRDKVEIQEERRRLREQQAAIGRHGASPFDLSDDHRLRGIASARGLLKFLIDD